MRYEHFYFLEATFWYIKLMKMANEEIDLGKWGKEMAWDWFEAHCRCHLHLSALVVFFMWSTRPSTYHFGRFWCILRGHDLVIWSHYDVILTYYLMVCLGVMLVKDMIYLLAAPCAIIMCLSHILCGASPFERISEYTPSIFELIHVWCIWLTLAID